MKRIKPNSLDKKGFTLIELLIVILIISVLASFLVRGIQEAKRRANRAAVVTMITSLNNGLKQYQSEYSYLPGRDAPGDPFDPKSNVISEVFRDLQGRYVEIKEADLGIIVPGTMLPKKATIQDINDDSIDKVIIDRWGRSLVARENASKEEKKPYMHNKDFMDIYSVGFNGEDDTIAMKDGKDNDDIGNW